MCRLSRLLQSSVTRSMFGWQITEASTKPYRAVLASMMLGTGAIVSYSVWASHHGASPCPLCIFQRMLFMGIASLAATGLLLPRKLSKAVAVSLLLVALGGLSVAVYQSLMQEFPGTVSSCGYADPTPIERIVDWAGMQSPFLFLATGYCERKDIAFLGLSWAQLSAMAFLLLSMTAVWLGLPARTSGAAHRTAR